MRNLFVFALALPLVACTVGSDGDPVEGDDDPNEHPNQGSGSGSGSGDGSGISGDLTADTTWTGAVKISGATTIKPGVTVTVEPGATLTFASNAGILVEGTLNVNGTSAGWVTMQPETGNFWSGIEVSGAYNLTYGIQKGGAIRTRGAAKLKVIDSKLWQASGDFLITNGGDVDISYSNVGAEPGTTDTTHCQLHFNRGTGTVKINNSNINGAPYGFMFYGGINADLKNNNWYDNAIDVDTLQGSPVSADFTGSYFDGTPPAAATGSTFTGLDALAPAKLTAGPRP